MESNLTQQLISWYEANARDLPWRKSTNPYHVWISEIMLQQTRVEAVIPYFNRFMTQFPTIQALANATEDEYLKIWEGLGYYSRILNIHKTANIIKDEANFPQNYDDLLVLPGIGPYTAAAIASISFHQPVPAIDGNLLRVFARVACCEENILDNKTKKAAYDFFERHIPTKNPGDFNQALMDLGAIVCTPKNPKCESCPIHSHCQAYLENKVDQLPVRIKKQKIINEKKTVLIIHVDDFVMLRKRASTGLLANMYEFPNVKNHLTQMEAIHYIESLGLKAIRIKQIESSKHVFSHRIWNMKAYEIFTQSSDFEKINASSLQLNEEAYNELFSNKLFLSSLKDIEKRWSIPSAFEKYKKHVLLNSH